MWRKAEKSTSNKFADVHTRIMKKNYRPVPQWWFGILLLIVLGLSMFTCEGFHKQLQLPFWGILLACAMAMIFMLPVGVLLATTNQVSG